MLFWPQTTPPFNRGLCLHTHTHHDHNQNVSSIFVCCVFLCKKSWGADATKRSFFHCRQFQVQHFSHHFGSVHRFSPFSFLSDAANNNRDASRGARPDNQNLFLPPEPLRHCEDFDFFFFWPPLPELWLIPDFTALEFFFHPNTSHLSSFERHVILYRQIGSNNLNFFGGKTSFIRQWPLLPKNVSQPNRSCGIQPVQLWRSRDRGALPEIL